MKTVYEERADKAEAARDEARRKYKQAKEYIEKMDAVIDDLKCAQSCINPLEDLKRATLALKERAEKAEAALADAAGINSPHNACQFRADCREADAEIARLREDAERYRWMRERHENTIMDIYNSISPAMISPELLDAAIDAARKDAK